MVASFSMATSETWKDKATGEKKESTEWHNIVAWRGLAEIASKFMHKGDLVFIEGKMKTRSWEKDGVTRYTTEVLADKVILLGGKRESSAPPPPDSAPESVRSAPAKQSPASMQDEVDSLPF